MNQPLGNAVGNALEVKEAIDTLPNAGPADFRDHCLTVAGKMVELAGQAPNLEAAKTMLARSLTDGTAWSVFVSTDLKEMIKNGDGRRIRLNYGRGPGHPAVPLDQEAVETGGAPGGQIPVD
jgi:thymidine phosphorylase